MSGDSATSKETPGHLGAQEWDSRWQAANTPWDLGGTTPALVDWCRRHRPRGYRVLVPGCGIGHDAHFLAKQGADVVGLDFSESALSAARAAYPASRVDWQKGDVTTMAFDQGFHGVWEYTCFCALLPQFRETYLQRVRAALLPGGIYWGMIFSSVPRPETGPPFQMDADAFHQLLSACFEVAQFERETARSVKPRRGKEIWFTARKA